MKPKGICRLCLNHTNFVNKFDESVLHLILFLINSHKFFPTNFINTLSIHENIVCQKCLNSLRTAVNLKRLHVSTCAEIGAELKTLNIDNLSLYKLTRFNGGPFKVICAICLHLAGINPVYLYMNSKNVIPPHFIRSMLSYCTFHVSSHIINPVLCNACWGNLQQIYDFKKTTDEIENLIRHYCETRKKHLISKSDLNHIYEIKQKDLVQSEKCLEDNFSEICKVFMNKANISSDEARESRTSIVLSNNVRKELEVVIPSTSANVVRSKETPVVINKPAPQAENAKLPVIKSSFCHTPNNSNTKDCMSYLIGDEGVRIKQEILSDSEDGDRPANVEALVDLDRTVDNDEMYYSEFDMDDLPPVLEPEEPIDNKLQKHTVFADEEKQELQQKNARKRKGNRKFNQQLLREPFVCDKCDFTTKFVFFKMNHEKLHTSNNTEKLHSCYVCNYKTTRITSLRQHMTTHKKAGLGASSNTPIDVDAPPVLQPQNGDVTFSDLKEKKLFMDDTNRPVVYRTIGSQHNKKVLKIIGYGSDENSLDESATSQNESVRRSSRKINPKNEYVRRYIKNRKHIIESPKNELIFTYDCTLCDFTTSIKKLLTSHLSAHKANTLILHYCVHCDFKTTKKMSLKTHQKIHLIQDGLLEITRKPARESLKFKMECPDLTCDLDDFSDGPIGSTPVDRKGAISLGKDDRSDKYKCKECDFSTSRFKDWRKHGTSCHNNTSAANSAAKRQKTNEMNGADVGQSMYQKYQCNECTFTTNQSRLFKKHRFDHHKQKVLCDSDNDPEMPVLSASVPSTSYEEKSEMLRESSVLENLHDSVISTYNPNSNSTAEDDYDDSEEVCIKLTPHEIKQSAEKTYERDKDFEKSLLEWFEKEILTNKSFGIKFLSQVLNAKKV